MKVISYPIMQIKCENCDCKFNFNYNDIYARPLPSGEEVYVRCPLCKDTIVLPNTYKEIRDKYEIPKEGEK